DGVQQRKNSWQDGVLGTNCPIPVGWNWTYQFQVKDQIGSFFYFPSINLQRAAGGYGGFTINNRVIIPVPFDTPHGDITLFIGDWFNKNHTDLRKELDQGKALGVPDGVLINGKGPYRYNNTIVPAGIDYETISVQPGKTYRLRVHNVGMFTCLNFRIQSHNLLLVETEGRTRCSRTTQVCEWLNWDRVVGVAILHYSNSKGKASGPLPDPPNDFYDKTYSMNQARSIRWNVTASGARPNPQGSFRYGSINVTQMYIVENKPTILIDGKRRATLNGISYSPPDTPLRLADQYDKKGVYKLDFPTRPDNGQLRIATSIINGTYKGFMEIVFQNNDTRVQSYHLDGYAFFVVGMDYGDWTENSRGTYNKWDGVARSTIQVYPGAWTAVLVSLDNVGTWNLRSEDLDSWYLGQETYISVVNPEGTNKTELPVPDNALYCGLLKDMQKPQTPHAQGEKSSSSLRSSLVSTVMLFLAAFPILLW
ncbi:hypothetical protein HPP92_028203, partial [Vanilla planifolia]